ncbi:hypothetical protein LX36DRAFT_230084 [Colletotrichum falcatum]|nr:hypothetical protein LX36DRAFT_230084 [Colletotrichum falcatum]
MVQVVLVEQVPSLPLVHSYIVRFFSTTLYYVAAFIWYSAVFMFANLPNSVSRPRLELNLALSQDPVVW